MGEHALTMSDDSLEQHIVTLFEKLECLRSANCDGILTGRVPARMEVRTLSLWKAVVAECTASFLYVFIVCGAAGGAGVGASASAVLLATALASGCAIATLTLCFAKISGAHVSPGVSVAQCVRRRVSPLRAALYVAAQCGGAIAGAAAVYGVSVPGHAGSLSAALPGGGAGGGAAWERLGAELVLSALVTAAYCAAMERRYSGAAPALLGAAYCAAGFVSMPSINPARSLGPSFVLSRWESHWVSWVGGLGGGVACALILEWGSRRPPVDLSRASSPRDLDQLDRVDKPFPYRSYCPAAPRPDPEPLYSGTKSLYCRSPPPSRHTLHRSQSVYSKGSSAAAGTSLVAAQSLLLRPHAAPLAAHNTHTVHSAHNAHTIHSAHNTHTIHSAHNAQNQNTHNAQREPTYGTANGVRPGPTGAAVPERRESVYSAGGSVGAGTGTGAAAGPRRGPLASDDSAYGSGTYRAYRPHPHDHY